MFFCYFSLWSEYVQTSLNHDVIHTTIRCGGELFSLIHKQNILKPEKEKLQTFWKMASVADMMEAECGPSNPLTDFARHLTQDMAKREELAAHGAAQAAAAGAGAAASGLSRPIPLHPAVGYRDISFWVGQA